MSQGVWIDREMSWIKFNQRVLNEALDKRTPLLERVNFLQIFNTNLDEYFMKRVGGLKRQKIAGIYSGLNKNIDPVEILLEIRNSLTPLLKQQADCWNNDILPSLNQEGLYLLNWSDLYSAEKLWVSAYFHSHLFPVLTPLSVDPGHPFPFISNLSNSLGVLLRHPRDYHESEEAYQEESLFARIKLPTTFPQWISIKLKQNPKEERWISLKQVVAHHLDALFPGMEVRDTFSFRVTRNADLERDEEDAEDLLEMITEELRERRFADVVRLEHSPEASRILVELLKFELELNEDEIYENSFDIDFSSMSSLFSLNRPSLKYKPWTPVIPQAFRSEEFQSGEKSVFSTIRDNDILVHHPYESFQHSVETFVIAAVNDPQVLAIKMALYRTGADSPFIPLLIQAAEAGKQVVCLVELKARFDEERNIQVARSLEKAGVHVVYGVVGLKTHCKVILVVRQESEEVRSYAHIGTGNYHSNTAKLYTDLGLFTAKNQFTDDISKLFHFLTGHSLSQNYRKLIIAPLQMKTRFLELIAFESKLAREGRPAQIIAKMNSLEDRDIIEALYAASQSGVQIDLIIRGFCCLRPQVPGLSEQIRVTSIIGRFLEHSRIFFFQQGAQIPLDGLYLIGSADWMSRNLTARVEAIVPIEDRLLKSRIYDLLQVMLHDQRQAWELNADGNYVQRRPSAHSTPLGTHEIQMKMY